MEDKRNCLGQNFTCSSKSSARLASGVQGSILVGPPAWARQRPPEGFRISLGEKSSLRIGIFFFQNGLLHPWIPNDYNDLHNYLFLSSKLIDKMGTKTPIWGPRARLYPCPPDLYIFSIFLGISGQQTSNMEKKTESAGGKVPGKSEVSTYLWVKNLILLTSQNRKIQYKQLIDICMHLSGHSDLVRVLWKRLRLGENVARPPPPSVQTLPANHVLKTRNGLIRHTST